MATREGRGSDFVGPGVLLDKYREKQRHGGNNENENKGALRNCGSPGTRGQRDDSEKTEILFWRTLRAELS